MRHAGLLLALLAAAAQLSACATTGTPGAMQGQSGPIAWEIVDVTQRLEENGSMMRWNYTFLFKNVGDAAIDFERMERSSRPGGSGELIGGISTSPFTHRLAPSSELRVDQYDSLSCSMCGPGHLPRLFSDGIIVYYTYFGRDGVGGAVRVPVAVRLNSSVGERK